ncbi:MAG: YebC/PmpR family DNA-binding transcriptional regulator [Pseudomonadales bacterium]|jgi:YebC/PmpR family DNA-binding regulatory protein|nr:YebC/PmpR family DNA-binding transcriptional regulator [Pseudomonadales bacterium]
MAGHSKWNNIKNKKGAEDAARAKVFTYLAKNIRLAAKQGNNGDPNTNPSLRLWVDKAKDANMPKDKIEKAINAGLGKGSGGVINEINYEAFGPGGVGMIISAATDNNNRTSGELKAILTRNEGSMAGPGSASYLFDFDKEKQEFICKMPMEIDDQTREKLDVLVDKLFEVDGVEGVYCAISKDVE